MKKSKLAKHIGKMLVVAVIAQQAMAVPVQWTEAAGGNGHYYERITSSLITWDDAEIAAESSVFLGARGHLATVYSDAENNFITNNLGGSVGNYWLGGFQPAGSPEPDGGWQWVTGEPWSYTGWNAPTGEPNNGAGGDPENALTYWGSGPGWNDYPNWATNEGYIVEYAPEMPYHVAWIHQLGTSAHDESYGVATDADGNVFISGDTTGNLDGQTNAGGADAFLSKYDASGGAPIWTRLLGTSENDYNRRVATDPSGNVLIGGRTFGDLEGSNAGLDDAFVSKYDASGNPLPPNWPHQHGTSGNDGSYDVATDASGNVFITGGTGEHLFSPGKAGNTDVFVVKYNDSGTVWEGHQLGTGDTDAGFGVVAAPDGNVFITGTSNGSFGGDSAGDYDAFVMKLDTTTWDILWSRQLGTSGLEESHALALDADGNIYITGWTTGDLDPSDGEPNAGGRDAFISKYDPLSGSTDPIWTRQLGTSGTDESYGVAVDGAGNVFISGWTEGDLDGQKNAGGPDVFLSMIDTSGNVLWTRLLGTSSGDKSMGVAVDAAGNVFISGYTYGSLPGYINAGGTDAFVAKYESVAEHYHAGDVDQDHFVGADDIVGILTGWGLTGASRQQGDLTGDDFVGVDDYVQVLTFWGSTYPEPHVPGEHETVPEPTTLGLVLMGGLAALRRRIRESTKARR